jgi:hypothetical protein
MCHFQYAVIAFDDGWRVLVNGRRLSRFSSQSCALQAAIDLAVQAQAMECDVELLLHDRRGALAAFPAPRPGDAHRAN